MWPFKRSIVLSLPIFSLLLFPPIPTLFNTFCYLFHFHLHNTCVLYHFPWNCHHDSLLVHSLLWVFDLNTHNQNFKFSIHIWNRLYIIHLSGSWLPHSEWLFPVLSIYLWNLPFKKINNIPLSICTICRKRRIQSTQLKLEHLYHDSSLQGSGITMEEEQKDCKFSNSRCLLRNSIC